METAEQLEIVRAEGCTEMQGFLFSPAVPARDIDKLLKGKRLLVMQDGAEHAA